MLLNVYTTARILQTICFSNQGLSQCPLETMESMTMSVGIGKSPQNGEEKYFPLLKENTNGELSNTRHRLHLLQV